MEHPSEPVLDLRTLDLPGFRRWLGLLLDRWGDDPVFIQRSRVRDLRRMHPELGRRESDVRRAARTDAASEQGPRLRELERRLHNTDRALFGLAAAIEHAAPERRPALEAKRQAFAGRRAESAREYDRLVRSSPSRQELMRLMTEVEQLRAATGLDQAEVVLKDSLTRRGRHAGRAGATFEDRVGEIAAGPLRGEMTTHAADVHVLRTVRLGAAGVELDSVLAQRPGRPEAPVEVLAVVEAKRNINDLAHGFRRRQIDLAWLTGDRAAYDPAEHRTGHFTGGHFDRPAVHWQDGEAFLFDPNSFRRFVRDAATGSYLDGLFLVTRWGPVWGLSGAALSRLAARVATDEEWDPASQPFLDGLFTWARSLAEGVETPDVLRLFREAGRERQVILV